MTQQDGYRELFRRSLHVTDQRSDHGKRHQLSEVLFVLVVAILAGAQDCEDVVEFGTDNLVWLRKFLTLQHGVASHGQVRRARTPDAAEASAVLALVPPSEIQRLIDGWSAALREPGALTVDGGHVAFDGQSLRGSVDRRLGLSAVHLVSAYFTDLGVTLGTMKVDDKSNEITAVSDLVRQLNLRGATVTGDALLCQREIAKAVREAGADYVLQVKGNQPNLLEDVEATMQELARRRRPGGGKRARACCGRAARRDIDKGHGRIETRVCLLSHDLSGIRDRGNWQDLAAIGAILREREDVISGKVSKEVSYFIASRATMTAAELAKICRDHWGIENGLHWSLDVVWGSDAHRVRNRTAAENLGRLRRFCAGLVKRATGWGMSGKRIRTSCGWNPDKILQVLAGNVIERQRRRRPNRNVVGRYGMGLNNPRTQPKT